MVIGHRVLHESRVNEGLMGDRGGHVRRGEPDTVWGQAMDYGQGLSCLVSDEFNLLILLSESAAPS